LKKIILPAASHSLPTDNRPYKPKIDKELITMIIKKLELIRR